MTAPEPPPPTEHEKVEASYDFVTTMVPYADDRVNLLWHGWALRKAFIAGAEWQEKRQKRAEQGRV